ncbi:MAG: Hydroxyacylglutathione hydrolase [Candidatus Carbobacillus altaicus]|uniref:Hydroxyacylglutathione hydrolase n=1 Tax=Candidatus Carbonibacillus altaicus TaxID=2163959 RepID=A0A2R6Y0I0_9BACL|nr:MAG: Hydroxyacylglutathione hydrolase [Candidatus Carbobacillus altaicus]
MINGVNEVLRVQSFVLGIAQSNSYLITDESTQEALLIDAGDGIEAYFPQLTAFKLQMVLLTHAHFDHIAGLRALKEAFDVPVYIHRTEADWLVDPKKNGSGWWPGFSPVIAPQPDGMIDETSMFHFAGQKIHILHVPGHSPGSLAYIIDGLAFVGDTLFNGSIGRTDLPGGDPVVLERSIREKLYCLPDDTILYPGHGAQTTIGWEKAHNAYVRG